jgi:enamine deaminase RidA (YjgF/YER057c/UK114 family)
MKTRVETLTPPNTPKPIGPYSHIAKVGQNITIGGTAGFDPATGQMAGPDIRSQTLRILQSPPQVHLSDPAEIKETLAMPMRKKAAP